MMRKQNIFKTSEILFNYYDILDGQIKQEIEEDDINKMQDISDKEISENSLIVDGFEIFNNNTNSKLEKLNKISQKKKRKNNERIKNIESLTKDNNYNIFDFINSNNTNSNENSSTYNVTDRATLYEDYKTIMDGYPTKKIYSKPCINCNIEKVLIYSKVYMHV